MSSANNSVRLTGRVGRDPVTTTFKSGAKVAKFSVAVNEYLGEGKVKTTWVNVEAWGANADRVAETLTKGREVVVEGRLSQNSYETKRDDKTVRVNELLVKLASFHACGKKPSATEAVESVDETSPVSEAPEVLELNVAAESEAPAAAIA